MRADNHLFDCMDYTRLKLRFDSGADLSNVYLTIEPKSGSLAHDFGGNKTPMARAFAKAMPFHKKILKKTFDDMAKSIMKKAKEKGLIMQEDTQTPATEEEIREEREAEMRKSLKEDVIGMFIELEDDHCNMNNDLIDAKREIKNLNEVNNELRVDEKRYEQRVQELVDKSNRNRKSIVSVKETIQKQGGVMARREGEGHTTEEDNAIFRDLYFELVGNISQCVHTYE